MFNSFVNIALFDKQVSLFNVYVIRVGLNNAATSRILVNPYLRIPFCQIMLYSKSHPN